MLIMQEDIMADDLNQRGQQDRSRINMNEPWEVKYWTRELGVSQEELARAVQQAGNSVTAVREQLKR
ncbi:DUF3606 domain-containing protein [Massilia solisilvae]